MQNFSLSHCNNYFLACFELCRADQFLLFCYTIEGYLPFVAYIFIYSSQHDSSYISDITFLRSKV